MDENHVCMCVCVWVYIMGWGMTEIGQVVYSPCLDGLILFSIHYGRGVLL